MYDAELFRAGLWRVYDLFNTDGSVISFHTWKTRGVSKPKFMLWRGLVNKVRTFSVNMYNKEAITNAGITITLTKNEAVNILCSNSKAIYSKLVQRKQEQPTAFKTYTNIFENLQESELSYIYMLPRFCTSDVLLKEFQFKILHRYLPTNELLYKMKKVDSPNCTFCNVYKESITHLFYECFCVKNLWFDINNRLNNIESVVVDLTCKDIILGCNVEHEN